MLMMEPPPPLTISGMACLHVSIWLLRFTAIVRSQTSRDSSVTGVSRDRKSDSVKAALLWRTSRRPNWATVDLIASATSDSFERSACTHMADPPEARMFSTTWVPPSTSTSTTATEAPSLARARAVAPPIPPAPPVTMATLFSRRPMSGHRNLSRRPSEQGGEGGQPSGIRVVMQNG